MWNLPKNLNTDLTFSVRVIWEGMHLMHRFSEISHSPTTQQLIDSEVILSVHWIMLPLNFLCTLTCILSGHKAQSLPPQLQMSRKPFENVWSSCRVSCFKGCQSSAFSPGDGDLTTNGSVCFSLPYLALCTITSITQHFNFRLAELTLSH